MSNTLTVDKVSTVLKAVLSQATGQDLTHSSLTTKELLTIGQKALETGTDGVMNAISQVLSRTVFSARPYTAKFAGMRIGDDTWGNWVRKLKVIDTPDDLTDNPYMDLEDGQSIDQWKVYKPNVFQVNFYGQKQYEFAKTIFETQLNTAFNSAEEFAQFISMVLTAINNKIEKVHEETARATITGYIAGKIANTSESGNVIHLLTEYNEATGLTLTKTTVMQPENYKPFIQWAYSRIANLSDLMEEYSANYQTNLNDGVFLQHTPKADQRVYLNSNFMHQASMMALADTYHDSFLSLAGDVEFVTYWQDINNPNAIKVTAPEYLAKDGSVATGANVDTDDVIGVICDREAFGYSPILTRQRATQPNARGEYYNLFWKYNERHSIDFTEKGIVLMMD